MHWLSTLAAVTVLFATPGGTQKLALPEPPVSVAMSKPASAEDDPSRVAGAPTTASFAYMKGSRLRALCNVSNLDPDQSLCLGYLEGVWDSLSVLNPVLATSDAYEFDLCLPPEIRIIEIKDLTLGWMQRHPARAEETAASLVILALLERFSCPEAAA